MKNLSLVGFSIAIISIVLFLFNDSLFATGPVGITVQVLAASLMLWARLTFGRRSFHASANPTEGGLVTSGPYKYFRHPIYSAIIYFAWAGVASQFSTYNCVLGIGVTSGLFLRMVVEERLVAEKYPEYKDYAKKTKRIIPFIF